MALNWKKLMRGQVVPERVNVKGMNVTLPVDAGIRKSFSVTGVNAELNLGRPGMVDIVKADAVVQGIRVTAQGHFPLVRMIPETLR
ncbi:MAG: hypothetical protein ACLRPT_06950 [Akkermansia muciniphila]